MKNFVVNSENETVQWHNMKTISFLSEEPNVFRYQNDYEGEHKCVDLFKG